MDLINHLVKMNLAHPPKWLPSNLVYLTQMGSVAYGCNNPDSSDEDLYGICVPSKSDIFPHLRGEIPGFGKQIQRFEQYQEHHHSEL